jgi:hypothetical protein
MEPICLLNCLCYCVIGRAASGSTIYPWVKPALNLFIRAWVLSTISRVGPAYVGLFFCINCSVAVSLFEGYGITPFSRAFCDDITTAGVTYRTVLCGYVML